MSTFSGVCGAGLSPAQAISPTPSTASRALLIAVSGCVAADTARAATSTPALTIPRTPAATISAPEGSRAATHSSSASGSFGLGTGSRSNSTVARSTPAMPSISA